MDKRGGRRDRRLLRSSSAASRTSLVLARQGIARRSWRGFSRSRPAVEATVLIQNRKKQTQVCRRAGRPRRLPPRRTDWSRDPWTRARSLRLTPKLPWVAANRAPVRSVLSNRKVQLNMSTKSSQRADLLFCQRHRPAADESTGVHAVRWMKRWLRSADAVREAASYSSERRDVYG